MESSTEFQAREGRMLEFEQLGRRQTVGTFVRFLLFAS